MTGKLLHLPTAPLRQEYQRHPLMRKPCSRLASPMSKIIAAGRDSGCFFAGLAGVLVASASGLANSISSRTIPNAPLLKNNGLAVA